MLKLFYVYCILMGFATISNSLSILLIQPVPSPSHHIWTMNLLKGLLRKGHHVHAISVQSEPNIKDKFGQNLTFTVFDNLIEEMQEDYNVTEWEQYSTFYSIYFVYQWTKSISEKIIETKAAKELLKMIKDIEFDVIVHDLTVPECLYGLWEVAKGRPPVVGYIPFGTVPWFKHYIGGPHYPNVRSYPYKYLAKPITL